MSLPPLPVQVAQVPQLVQPIPQVAPQLVPQGPQVHVPQAAPQVGPQLMPQLAPQPAPQIVGQHATALSQQVQQQQPQIQGQVPANLQQAAIATTAGPHAIPVYIQQTGNPVLQSALNQAMGQQSLTEGVTMDDIANLLITSGRASLYYRGANASQEFQRQFHRC